MAKLAAHLWMDVEWVRPDLDEPLPPTEDGSIRSPADESRARVYIRDMEYVRRADLVMAYFSTTEMSGGTGHVVEKAVDQDVPVYSWGLEEGHPGGRRFIRIGEHDPFGAWASSVPG